VSHTHLGFSRAGMTIKDESTADAARPFQMTLGLDLITDEEQCSS